MSQVQKHHTQPLKPELSAQESVGVEQYGPPTYILVSGVRHQTASIDVREKFALSEVEIESAIPALLQEEGVLECAILTTCNRTEIYILSKAPEHGQAAVRNFFLKTKKLDINEYRPGVFTLFDDAAVKHLFQVASGLDSLILGEGQILAQVKETLATAQRLHSNGQIIDRLFKAAISVGKRVRTETGIAHRDVSVSRAAFDFIQKQDPNALERQIALVGGGKMIEILLGALKRALADGSHQGRVRLVNRSEARLKTLCEKFQFEGFLWDDLQTVLNQSDIIFVATGAPHPVLFIDSFSHTAHPQTIVDISVPRNVEPSVGELPGVSLFNTDDLHGIHGFSEETEQRLQTQAETIIQEELAQFYQWFMTFPVVGPMVLSLRQKIEGIRQTEAACQCPVIGTSCSVIDSLSRNLVNKILHDPIVQLKNSKNLEEIYQQAAFLSNLFKLEAGSAPDSSKIPVEIPASLNTPS